MKAPKNELTVLSNTFGNIPQNVVPNENAQHPYSLPDRQNQQTHQQYTM
jgi:hypothetical protein